MINRQFQVAPRWGLQRYDQQCSFICPWFAFWANFGGYDMLRHAIGLWEFGFEWSRVRDWRPHGPTFQRVWKRTFTESHGMPYSRSQR